jgi:hypothetical protein
LDWKRQTLYQFPKAIVVVFSNLWYWIRRQNNLQWKCTFVGVICKWYVFQESAVDNHVIESSGSKPSRCTIRMIEVCFNFFEWWQRQILGLIWSQSLAYFSCKGSDVDILAKSPEKILKPIIVGGGTNWNWNWIRPRSVWCRCILHFLEISKSNHRWYALILYFFQNSFFLPLQEQEIKDSNYIKAVRIETIVFI